jgi:hypothetical protein
VTGVLLYIGVSALSTLVAPPLFDRLTIPHSSTAP